MISKKDAARLANRHWTDINAFAQEFLAIAVASNEKPKVELALPLAENSRRIAPTTEPEAVVPRNRSSVSVVENLAEGPTGGSPSTGVPVPSRPSGTRDRSVSVVDRSPLSQEARKEKAKEDFITMIKSSEGLLASLSIPTSTERGNYESVSFDPGPSHVQLRRQDHRSPGSPVFPPNSALGLLSPRQDAPIQERPPGRVPSTQPDPSVQPQALLPEGSYRSIRYDVSPSPRPFDRASFGVPTPPDSTYTPSPLPARPSISSDAVTEEALEKTDHIPSDDFKYPTLIGKVTGGSGKTWTALIYPRFPGSTSDPDQDTVNVTVLNATDKTVAPTGQYIGPLIELPNVNNNDDNDIFYMLPDQPVWARITSASITPSTGATYGTGQVLIQDDTGTSFTDSAIAPVPVCNGTSYTITPGAVWKLVYIEKSYGKWQVIGVQDCSMIGSTAGGGGALSPMAHQPAPNVVTTGQDGFMLMAASLSARSPAISPLHRAPIFMP